MDTNAWGYLNITRPVCAWATYRGALVPADNSIGNISTWTAGRLWAQDFAWLEVEAMLESVRQVAFLDRVSRLKGVYVFPDVLSAQRASSWSGDTFQSRYLAELHVVGGLTGTATMDANWITHALSGDLPDDWPFSYWSGEAFPGAEPIWEVVVSNRAYVLGTELRERAYQVIKRYLPDTLSILEIGRLAAATGSDLGNIACNIFDDGDHISSRHLLDMRDADDPVFLQRLGELLAAGHPKRQEALDVGAEQGIFTLPDMRPLDFTVSKTDLIELKLFGVS